MRQTIVIGDVHGCISELHALLHACEFRPGDDVVFVGDLVGRGPDSKGVLDFVKKIGGRSVLGNHDHALLSWKKAVRNREEPTVLPRSLSLLTTVLTEENWRLLEDFPFFLRLPDHKAIVVHAGLEPGIDLERQDPFILLNVRTIRSDGTGSESKTEGPLWGSLWKGPETVFFGHHASQGLQLHPHAIGIDTGCVYGGELTACLLPERRIVSVKAKRGYASTKGA
ncbi:MAG: metallophosphoesterase [Deltaproteobacteria bacterium]|nr:metallophosphoesterase [Deltaproteobacteria bacterium]